MQKPGHFLKDKAEPLFQAAFTISTPMRDKLTLYACKKT